LRPDADTDPELLLSAAERDLETLATDVKVEAEKADFDEDGAPDLASEDVGKTFIEDTQDGPGAVLDPETLLEAEAPLCEAGRSKYERKYASE
jgi:hypothetical protein